MLSVHTSAKSLIIGSTVSVLTAKKAFLNNFGNVVNRRVDIWEDIKRYQNTLSYASSKVNCSMGESIYMLPSDINLNIKSETARHNDKILVSNSGVSLGKNDMVNSSESKEPPCQSCPQRSPDESEKS